MITVRDLTMRYGRYTALERVSCTANPGEILGLLGPNGAGKTTLMRILTTYLYPTGGSASVAGFDVITHPLEARARLGYLPESVPLYFSMQTEEYLLFIARARGLRGPRLRERLDWVRRACGLAPVWKHTLTELSKGFRQRTGLAQALIHDPDVLILDEPTSGLDPVQILEMRQLVRSLAAQKTILFSTHILQEVAALGDRIVIINDGRVVAAGTREEITRRGQGGQQVRLAVQADRATAETALRGLAGIEAVRYDGALGDAHAFVVRGASGPPLTRALDALARQQGWALRHLAEEGASLEEAFLALLKSSGKERP